MEDRSFSDEELALIISRASRVHDTASESRHSLADVQQIAEQVGLPPDIVAAVAADLGRPDDERHLVRMLLGPSGRFVTSVDVARRVTPEDYPALLEVIRAEVKTVGNATQIGPQLEWRALAESESGHVGNLIIWVTSREGAARVRVDNNLNPLRNYMHVAGAMAGAVFGLIGSSEAGLPPPMVAAITLGAASLGWGITRAMWRKCRRTFEARAHRIQQAIASHLARSAGVEERRP